MSLRRSLSKCENRCVLLFSAEFPTAILLSFFFLWLRPWKINQSINTQTGRKDEILSLRINLQQISYSNGSFQHINILEICFHSGKPCWLPAKSSTALFYQSFLSTMTFLFVFEHAVLPIVYHVFLRIVNNILNFFSKAVWLPLIAQVRYPETKNAF